jgi:hypothetical protein
MGVTRVTRWAIGAGLLGWWGFVEWPMQRAMRRDPGPTGLPGDLPNWHNSPCDLTAFLVMTLLEPVVVAGLLRPWSYDRSWRRASRAFMIPLPWTLLFLLMLMHSGSVMVWHVTWLVGLILGIACLADGSVVPLKPLPEMTLPLILMR